MCAVSDAMQSAITTWRQLQVAQLIRPFKHADSTGFKVRAGNATRRASAKKEVLSQEERSALTQQFIAIVGLYACDSGAGTVLGMSAQLNAVLSSMKSSDNPLMRIVHHVWHRSHRETVDVMIKMEPGARDSTVQLMCCNAGCEIGSVLLTSSVNWRPLLYAAHLYGVLQKRLVMHACLYDTETDVALENVNHGAILECDMLAYALWCLSVTLTHCGCVCDHMLNDIVNARANRIGVLITENSCDGTACGAFLHSLLCDVSGGSPPEKISVPKDTFDVSQALINLHLWMCCNQLRDPECAVDV